MKVAIYLMKERTGSTHKEIGKGFLGLSEASRPKIGAFSQHPRNSAVGKLSKDLKNKFMGTGNSGQAQSYSN